MNRSGVMMNKKAIIKELNNVHNIWAKILIELPHEGSTSGNQWSNLINMAKALEKLDMIIDKRNARKS